VVHNTALNSSDNLSSYLPGKKVKCPHIYIPPPLTGKPEQRRFTMQSNALTSISSRRRSAIGGPYCPNKRTLDHNSDDVLWWKGGKMKKDHKHNTPTFDSEIRVGKYEFPSPMERCNSALRRNTSCIYHLSDHWPGSTVSQVTVDLYRSLVII